MEYTITKKKIKNFILRIYPDLTIAVSAPLSATSKDIENFVLSKKEWIEKTLEKLENLKDDSIKILGKKVEKKSYSVRFRKNKFNWQKYIYIYKE